jgi:3-methyladenine DNA glycosylase AlkD
VDRPLSARAIERRLRDLGDPKRAEHSLRFFRTGPGEYGEGDRFLGLTVPQVRRLARECKTCSLDVLEQLLQSPWHEARLLALVIMVEQCRRDSAAREPIRALYLRNAHRVNNWDLVDCSAPHIVGTGDGALLDRLAQSPSLWERRMAIMATFDGIRRDDVGDALRIAAALVGDGHDLIHKAVGWMLREVGRRDRAAEERFLRKYAARMPRTMLRYAIERFPKRSRRQYLAGRK